VWGDPSFAASDVWLPHAFETVLSPASGENAPAVLWPFPKRERPAAENRATPFLAPCRTPSKISILPNGQVLDFAGEEIFLTPFHPRTHDPLP